jgi:hypothetical protein
MAGGQRLISWLHPCSTSNVALNTRTCAHGPLMGHPNWARCDIDSVKKWGYEHAEARSLELSMARTSEDGRFGDLSRAKFGSHARGHARTSGEAKANSGIC